MDTHLAFAHGDQFMPFVQTFGHAFQPPVNFHVNFDKSPFAPGGPCTKPVTELMQCSFPAAAVPVDAEIVLKDYADGLQAAKQPGFGGYAWGWMVEEPDDDRFEGGKAKCLVAAFGWDSVEAHQEMRNNPNPNTDVQRTKFTSTFNNISSVSLAGPFCC